METQEIKEKLEEIEAIKKVRELAEKIKDAQVAVLTTAGELGYPHSQPMYTHSLKDDGIIWFITSKEYHKTNEIAANAKVSVTYSVPADNLYVAIYGTATLTDNPHMIDELWSDRFRAWFPKGKTDPDITLIRIDMEHIEYWDGPDSIVSQLISIVKATLAGNPYQVVEHKKVDVHHQ